MVDDQVLDTSFDPVSLALDPHQYADVVVALIASSHLERKTSGLVQGCDLAATTWSLKYCRHLYEGPMLAMAGC